ncbi:MAG: DUF423 domain-containing protein [Burkholderiaceae bacterium]|nr:DUF423 domain-containing protein [Burkholderiaceae bacterium]
MTERLLVIIGALILLTGVGAGAFGAHALKRLVSPDMLAVWQTAVLYQLIHGLGLLAIAALRIRYNTPPMTYAGIFMLAGVLIFSGTLYTLVLTNIRWLGAITPIGGASLMVAWALLAWAAWRSA